MIVLRDLSVIPLISHPEIRQLLDLRCHQLTDAAVTLATPIEFIIVEAGDTPGDLAAVSGCSLEHGLFDDLAYGDPDFMPWWELLEEHISSAGSVYEMVFILNDDGYAVVLFIPKADGIDPKLLALCADYAVPAA